MHFQRWCEKCTDLQWACGRHVRVHSTTVWKWGREMVSSFSFFKWTLQISRYSMSPVLYFYFQVRVRFCWACSLKLCTVLRKSGKTGREKGPHIYLQLSPQIRKWLLKMGKFPHWWSWERTVFCLSSVFSIYQMKSLSFPSVNVFTMKLFLFYLSSLYYVGFF